MESSQFKQLGLNSSILKSLDEEGYTEPTPIQIAAIPELMAGKDLMATAQTGTGKTAAFSLPILHRLNKGRKRGKGFLGLMRKSRDTGLIRALILTPTRELALQIHQSFCDYGRHLPLRTVVILGGVSSRPQIQALEQGADILVATPGRFLDLYGQGFIPLVDVELFVLDEADRMLDMGFIDDVREIVGLLPKERQTMLFSATISRGVASLASNMLKNPERVDVTPYASIPEVITQNVLFVDQRHKYSLLTSILQDKEVKRALVFTRTKFKAERLSRQLSRNRIRAQAIHSNKSQGARQRALSAFDKGRARILVATDIMARGIDVEGITHVINYDMPEGPENYVHRIGRTARAGALGTALSFCDVGEVGHLSAIEKLIGRRLTVVEENPFHSDFVGMMHKQTYVPDSEPVNENSKKFGRGPGKSKRRALRR